MNQKKLPLSKEALEALREEYGTPFHLYVEQDIRENVRRFQKAFAWAPSFYEYFAVKALPNPYIMKILKEEGCGADCSSMAELILSEKVGLSGSQICFTSNDTPVVEFQKAFELDAIINLDDITHLEYLKKNVGLPSVISFRYNPGPMRGGGNDIIGQPEQAKYGLTKAQMFEGFKKAQEMGVTRFGLHTMIVSNELNVCYLVGTATMMFELARE
ncbi:MAG: diaminopimelate decarboxylase, partial [Firmicutes bacterium]|nr:diaminopimelate decarboxylase [Bacillota bacterium]